MKARNFVNPKAPAARSQTCIYGIHAVTEWLRVQPVRLRTIHYQPRIAMRIAELLRLATRAGIAAQPADDRTLTTLAGSGSHQGIVATAAPFPYADAARLDVESGRLLVAADQLQDPHNVGALLRTAAAVGAAGVITPKDNSVPITATVEAAAAGMTALIPVYRVTNLVRTLHALKQRQYWAVGLAPHDGTDLFQFRAPERVVLVLGGETGMRPLIAKECDFLLSIPMLGGVESLNASVAAAIVAYELLRQWRAP